MRPCLDFIGTLGSHAFACAASSASSIIRPSWVSTTNMQERNLKLQSPDVFSSPENTSGFQILVSMIPRPAGGACGDGLAENCSAHSVCLSCRLLFCSVPNRRTSLTSVCTISACLCRPEPTACSAVTLMIHAVPPSVSSAAMLVEISPSRTRV